MAFISTKVEDTVGHFQCWTLQAEGNREPEIIRIDGFREVTGPSREYHIVVTLFCDIKFYIFHKAMAWNGIFCTMNGDGLRHSTDVREKYR